MTSIEQAPPLWRRISGVLLTLWAGSMWTVCAIVAPTLFKVLDSRQTAGQLAARFFHFEAYLSLVAGALLLALAAAGRISSLNRWTIIVPACLPIASQLVLGPFMEQARMAGDMARFGLLHGMAGACYFVSCLLLILVVWRFNRPGE